MRSERKLVNGISKRYNKRNIQSILVFCILTGALSGCEKPPDLFGIKNQKDSEILEQTPFPPQQGNNNPYEITEEPVSGTIENKLTTNYSDAESNQRLPSQKMTAEGGNKTQSSYIVEGALVIRRPLQTEEYGVWGLEILLDEEKINRVNQRRDIDRLEERPDLFGINSDFKPLFTINTAKKGFIEISSPSLGRIKIETSELSEHLEIYPFFNLNSLLENKKIEEEVEIVFIDGEARSLIEKPKLVFSKANEIYAEDANLSDVASFTKLLGNELEAKNNSDRYQGIKSSTDLIKAAIGGLELYNIKYEKWEDRSGYKKIRTPPESKAEKSITDLEICIWLSAMMKQTGMDPIIVVTENKILLGIKEENKEDNSSTINYLDPEGLLINEDITKENNITDHYKYRIDKSIIKGNHIMREEFEKSPKKIFALNIKEWENMFRSTKTHEELD